jgi:hypothetical protein
VYKDEYLIEGSKLKETGTQLIGGYCETARGAPRWGALQIPMIKEVNIWNWK